LSGGNPALERLWAGWRSIFVTTVDGDDPKPDCVFCAILASGLPDEDTHILWRHRNGLVVAILNLYPYTSGHLMVMPARHVGDLEALTGDESAALWAAMAEAIRALKSAYRPDAINMGANIGRAAGAGVPDHFHVHVVPRWSGDTNFMTTVAEARVLPEAITDTWRRLRAAWPEPAPGS
jgi:ATP adenylyltransferase